MLTLALVSTDHLTHICAAAFHYDVMLDTSLASGNKDVLAKLNGIEFCAKLVCRVYGYQFLKVNHTQLLQVSIYLIKVATRDQYCKCSFGSRCLSAAVIN